MLSGREKKDSEAANILLVSLVVMPWLVRTKKPSVSAAWMSSEVMVEMRVVKS